MGNSITRTSASKSYPPPLATNKIFSWIFLKITIRIILIKRRASHHQIQTILGSRTKIPTNNEQRASRVSQQIRIIPHAVILGQRQPPRQISLQSLDQLNIPCLSSCPQSHPINNAQTSIMLVSYSPRTICLCSPTLNS